MEPNTQRPSSEPKSSATADSTQRSRSHEERLLDQALADTFPCSDPVSTLTIDEAPEPTEPQRSSDSKRH